MCHCVCNCHLESYSNVLHNRYKPIIQHFSKTAAFDNLIGQVYNHVPFPMKCQSQDIIMACVQNACVIVGILEKSFSKPEEHF